MHYKINKIYVLTPYTAGAFDKEKNEITFDTLGK